MKKILVFLFLSINFLIFGQNSKLFVSFIEKAELNFKKKNYPKAILLGKQALVEAQEYKSPKNKIISFHLLGKISYEQKDYTTSKQYFKQGLQLFAKKDTSVDKTNLLIDLSKSYNSAGEFDSAIFYLTSILSYHDSKKHQILSGQLHSLLGLNYCNVQEFNLSKKHLLHALSFLNDGKNDFACSKVYANLGDLNAKFNDHKKALAYFKMGIKLIPKNEEYFYEVALANIAAMYVELKELDSAKLYINRAFYLSKKINDKLGESICVNNLATIYRDQNKTQESLKYYLLALKMVDSLGSKNEKKAILLNISEAYGRLGSFQKSLDYYQEYTNLKDELFNSEKAEFIVETQEKYKASQREKEIAELKVKKQQNETEKLTMKYSILLGVIIVILIFVLIFWFYRAKMIRLENEKNYAINTAALDSEEKERLRISQEIHDDLGGVLGMSRMLFSTAKKHLLEQDKELYLRIDNLLLEANNRSRAISHELFSPTLKEFGIIKALDELFCNMKKAKPEIQIIYDSKGSDEDLNDQIALNLYRVIQELINNTFKYAMANVVELHFEINSELILMSYNDNGVGVDLEVGKHGIGLKSIQSRVKRVNGSVKFISSPGKGFKTLIEIEK